jgi:iron(III) transport system ATP-binding protein
MLTVKNISYTYPSENKPALNRISFTLKKGTVLGIAGTSGSGKSTLLKAIYGLIDLQEGEISFNKQKVSGPSKNLIPGHLQMRLSGQFHSLQNSLPVIEQIKYKLLNYEKSFREKKAKQLLSLVGLEKYGMKLPKELSGGQQQMINLCCALAEEPELLLLDEPFNNLDQTSKNNLKKYLIKLKISGMSIIVVSHDPMDLLSFSDEILILKDGKKIRMEPPEKIYFDPKNEYTAALFGEYNKVKSKFIRPSQVQLSLNKKSGFTEGIIASTQFRGTVYLYEISSEKKKILAASTLYYKPGKIFYMI